MKVKVLRELFHTELNKINSKEEINSFFYLLCENILNRSRIDLALQPELELTKNSENTFRQALQQLRESYPIQYIIGSTEFMELDFDVNESVLIPRPETEELVNWIISSASKEADLGILDIGTGSGCISVSLAKCLPASLVKAMDVSEKALEVAKTNAIKNRASVTFMKENVFELDKLPNKYDIIVSNPPYVRESEKKHMRNNVLKFEPDIALFVTDTDPLIFYRHIAKLALKGLNSNGALYFEINQYLGNELTSLLEKLGFKNIELKKDIYGAERMIRAIKK